MNSVWDLLVSAIVLSYKYIQLNIFNENLDIWVWSSRKRAEREQTSEWKWMKGLCNCHHILTEWVRSPKGWYRLEHEVVNQGQSPRETITGLDLHRSELIGQMVA